MGVRFRETYGLWGFGIQGPARHQCHGILLAWPASVSIRLPRLGAGFQKNKQ